MEFIYKAYKYFSTSLKIGYFISGYLIFFLNIYRHHASPATDRVGGDPVLLDLRHGLAAHVAHGGPELLRLRADC